MGTARVRPSALWTISFRTGLWLFRSSRERASVLRDKPADVLPVCAENTGRMGGGSSKAKKNIVQAVDGSEVGADETASVAELAKRSREANNGIKPLPGMELIGGQGTPAGLPKTFSESLRESPPDDDFGSSDDFLLQLAGGKGGSGSAQPGTPPGFQQRSSKWEAPPVQASPARAIGGDSWHAGESTDIGGWDGAIEQRVAHDNCLYPRLLIGQPRSTEHACHF